LYAGGERPFFEDIETMEPTVYMIHNLLTLSECQLLMEQAQQQGYRSVMTSTPSSSYSSNPLIEYMTDTTPYQNIDRTVLHPGFFQSLILKAVDERIEQVTGFPINHYSEWIIDRITINSTYHPHYDNTYIPHELIPHATITVFLNDLSNDMDRVEGGQLVYPTIGSKTSKKNQNRNTDPILIHSTQGLGVVHHNTNEKQHLETYSLHGLLPLTYKSYDNHGSDNTNPVPYLYIARKYILPVPISKIRRYTIPIYLLLFGRHGNTFVTNLLQDWYKLCIQQSWGIDNGILYFDYIIVGVPIVFLIVLFTIIGYMIYRQLILPSHDVAVTETTTTSNTSTTKTTIPPPPKKSKSKTTDTHHKAPMTTKKKN
jgi:hypothetical protein